MALVKRGEVWWAWVPYNDVEQGGKRRPVLVLGWSVEGYGQDAVVLVVPLTSFGDGAAPRHGDVATSDSRFDYKGRPSYIRARRLFGLDPVLLRNSRKLGDVSDTVYAAVLLEIEKMFGVP